MKGGADSSDDDVSPPRSPARWGPAPSPAPISVCAGSEARSGEMEPAESSASPASRFERLQSMSDEQLRVLSARGSQHDERLLVQDASAGHAHAWSYRPEPCPPAP
eukprot:11545731-Alexandrium_andersonii.AAC.1